MTLEFYVDEGETWTAPDGCEWFLRFVVSGERSVTCLGCGVDVAGPYTLEDYVRWYEGARTVTRW